MGYFWTGSAQHIVSFVAAESLIRSKSSEHSCSVTPKKRKERKAHTRTH